MRKSFDYTKRSPLHKRQSRNRILKKVNFLLRVVGVLMLIFFGLMAALYPLRAVADREVHQTMMYMYAGAGAICWLLRWLVERLRSAYMGPQDVSRSARKKAYRKAAASDRKKRSRRTRFVRKVPEQQPDEQGAVLILVLVLIALITGLLLQTQISARHRLRLHQTKLQQVQLRSAAAEGIRYALHLLATDDDLQVDHLEEPWNKPVSYIDPNQVSVEFSVQDENRYFDINNLSVPMDPEAVVRRPQAIYVELLNQCGEFSGTLLSKAFIDWVDANEDGPKEKSFYLAQDPPYQPTNHHLYQWNELLWIDGYNRSMFDRKSSDSMFDQHRGNLLDACTLLPVQRPVPVPVNINTADKMTLLGLLGHGYEGLVEHILAVRLHRPLRNLESFVSAQDPQLVERWRPYLSLKSSYFRIRASATIEGHTEQIQSLALRDGTGDMRILQWVF